MKIAIHNPRASYFLGGSEVTTIEFAKILSKKFDVTINTSNNKKTQNFEELVSESKNININYFNCPKNSKIISHDILNKWDIEELIFGEATKEFYEKNKFDLIVVFYSTDLVLLNKKNSKTFLHLQGYPKIEKMLDQIAFSKADKIICCSHHVLREMESKFKIKLKEVYHSSSDINKFKPKIKKRDIDILYVGRLTTRKGADLLIKALSKIKNDFNKCVIAGEGELKEKLKRLIINYDLNKKIQIVGPIEKNKVIELMNRSKIFVLPAKKSEPFSKAILEAMIMGCAVISTSVGGTPEMITPGIDGILIPVEDYKNLFKSIQFLLDNENERIRLSKEAQKKNSKKI